jgi:hypothetical protein
MDISFEDFKEKLGYGHELHFIYMDEYYSITHVPYEMTERLCDKGLLFGKFGNPEFQTFKDDSDLIENAMINGKLLSEIWNDIIIDEIF